MKHFEDYACNYFVFNKVQQIPAATIIITSQGISFGYVHTQSPQDSSMQRKSDKINTKKITGTPESSHMKKGTEAHAISVFTYHM